MALIAPSVALLCKECLCQDATTTGSSSSSNSNICPDFSSRNPHSHIMRASHLALSTLPFHSRIYVVHSPLTYTIAEWLSSSGRQQQQQLLDTLSSKDFEWYVWNTLAAAVGRLHTSRHGRSGALGCKALKAPTASQWGPLGMLGDVGDDVLVPHLDRVLGCLRALYLVLPSDSCLAQLRCFHQQQQQQQQQQEATGVEGVAAEEGSSSSSSSIGRSLIGSSSSSSGRSTSITRQAETSSSSIGMRGSSSKKVISGGAAAHGHLAAAAAATGGGCGGVAFQQLMDRMCGACGAFRAPGCLWLLPPQPGLALARVMGGLKYAKGEGKGQERSAGGQVGSKQAGGGGKPVTGGAGLTSGGAPGRGLEDDALSFRHLELVLNLLLLSWPISGSDANGGGAAASRGKGAPGGRSAGASAAAGEAMAGCNPGAKPGRSASGAIGSSSSRQAADQRTRTKAQQRGDGKGTGPSLSQQEQEVRRGMLLLLVALLQKAPAEAKQQLSQDHGSLLLQLLYRVLVNQEDMGDEEVSPATVLASGAAFSDISLHLAEASGVEYRSADRLRHCFLAASAPVSMIQLVLMVLQGLMFVVDPWEAAGGGKQLLEQSLMVGLKEGEADGGT